MFLAPSSRSAKRQAWFAISSLLVSLCCADSAQGLGVPVISEFLASNKDGIADQDGDQSDWIEIWNSGDTAVDLGGYALTDNADLPSKWVFPSRMLAAGGRLIVFASGKNRRPVSGDLHTGFSLDAAGEYLALVAPDGVTRVTEFAPGFPKQRDDVSYGFSRGTTADKVLAEGAQGRWLVPAGPVAGWVASDFDDAGWNAGATGIGYDSDDSYDPFIGAGGDVEAEMFDINGSAYLRVPFEIDNPAVVEGMLLRMKYDDGFIAYVNGLRVTASPEAPADPAWDAFATEEHFDSLALDFVEFNLDGFVSALVPGRNVLAIHGLNWNVISTDFLIVPELEVRVFDPDNPEVSGFMIRPTPGAGNGDAVEGFVKDTRFSLRRGFFDTAQTLEITSATEGAVIRFTTDGTMPTESNGMNYNGPITIDETTIVRAFAMKERWQATNVDTQTYLFAGDVFLQPEMNRAVYLREPYSGTIESDLSTNLPVVSLVVDDAAFFGPAGIYANPNLGGRAAEVPVSMEFFDPLGADEFQIDAGVRIHGGNARSHPKKPLRLYFRSEYGDKRLRFPLLPGSPVESFDQLVLRGGGHDSWSLASSFGIDPSFDIPANTALMRDQFIRRTETEMGLLSPRGRYVHVYINGTYWGVYDIHERPNAAYFKDHAGGDESDWDVLHHPESFGQDHSIVDGSDAAWVRLMELSRKGVNTEADYLEMQEYLDLDQYIDHLIVRIWSGDFDWVGPIFRGGRDASFFANKNWYAGRRSRGGEPGKFRIFTWDAEMSMGLHLLVNRGFGPVRQRVIDFDHTRVSSPGSPVAPYATLRRWPAFQQRFADRLYKHFFNRGTMTVANNRARLEDLEDQLDEAIVAESARWGQTANAATFPFTRDREWQWTVDFLKDSFIELRNGLVLKQFQSIDLYPDVDPPVFNREGGEVSAGFRLSMSGGGGGSTVYFTTDGTDPFEAVPLTKTPLVDESSPVRVLVPSAANGGIAMRSTWVEIAEPDNIAEWKSGFNGIGYELQPDSYADLIKTDVSEMSGVNGSVMARFTFSIESQQQLDALDGLRLLMRYDDGFSAFLNGNRIAVSNAPATLPWDAESTANRSDIDALVFETFNIDTFLGELVVGANVLAIQGLNDTANSSDLLLLARLEGIEGATVAGVSPTAVEYGARVSLESTTRIMARTLSDEGEWSALHEVTFLVGTLASSRNLRISEFSYRPLGPQTPSEAAVATGRSDFEFIELANFSDEPIDLTNVAFTEGVAFKFDGAAAGWVLDPGGRVLVVGNQAAFLARFGDGLEPQVAGEFREGTRLSNSGETLTLVAADGEIIQSFRYDDSQPWPESPDGGGNALEFAGTDGDDPSDPSSWRAGLDLHGTPGSAGITGFDAWRTRYFDPADPEFAAISAPDADSDRDGFPNIVEFLLVSNPIDGADVPDVEFKMIDDGGEIYPGFALRRRLGIDAISIVLESSPDLVSWTVAASGFRDAVPESDGTETGFMRADTAVSERRSLHLRLRVTLLPDP